MRCRMRRRSVSSFVSPGPRVPMPPPSRDSAALEPTSRGSRYFSCASSTCSLPFARARAAREDVEDELRAIDDLAIERLLEIAQLRRGQLVVEDDDVDAQLVARRRRAPGPCRCRGRSPDRASAAPAARAARRRAGGRGQAGQLVERMFGIEVAGGAAREIEESDERRTFVPVGGSRASNRLRRRLRRASTQLLGAESGR